MFKNYRDLQDVVSLMIYCTSDKTFLMLKEISGEYWIPSMKSYKYSWKKTAHKILSEICDTIPWHLSRVPVNPTAHVVADQLRLFREFVALSFPALYMSQSVFTQFMLEVGWQSVSCLSCCEFPNTFGVDYATQLQPLRICKIWLPNHSSPCVYHAVYKLLIRSDTKKRLKSNVRYRVQWLSEVDLERLQLHYALRSPELIMLAKMVTCDPLREGDMLDIERGQLIEIDEESIVWSAGEAGGAASSSPQTQLLSAAKYTKDDQLRLFREFVALSFPALYMSQSVFTQFMLEVGWQSVSCPDLFRAADVGNRGGLSFGELAAWAAATEPEIQHAGVPAEMRCRYIFRYYDGDGDQQLLAGELQRLVAEARGARGLPVDTLSVLRDADLCYKHLGLCAGAPLPLTDFLRLVREMRLRGTSCLLRAPTTTLGYVFDLQERDGMDTILTSDKEPAKSSTQPEVQPVKGIVQAVEGEYCLGRGVLQVQRGKDPILLPLHDLDEETVSRSALQLLRSSSTSMQLLAPHSLASDALSAVRYFASEVNTPTQVKAAWEWGQGDAATLGGTLLRLSAAVKPIFAEEARLLRLHSPIYVIGDLHGNLEALLAMEAVLWAHGGALSPAGLLFLGDYVDRGPYGAELLAFLFASKLQRPRTLHLIRGNHETRDVQTMFTFFTECKTKFGETEGVKIWEAINEVFDVLPLAAVVDEKVFCCHGGIPPPWVCARASAIERIPVPLPRPAHQSHLAWELLWNDPVSPERISATLAMELAANEGFAANPRRGTGHVFEQRALDRFLLVNGFSHVVRAHQLHHNGFMCQLQGKLVSVFSSSHYCGGNNDSGAVLLATGKLRLIRIAT